MTAAELGDFVKSVAPILRDQIALGVEQAVKERFAAIPAGPVGLTGPKGDPGKDADLAVIVELKAEIATLRKALEAQSTPAEWRAFITEQVAAEVSALPPAPAGKDGAKGDVGERGPEGVQGLPGRDGRDGVNGEKGERGDSGLAGKDGMNGRDGTLEHLKAVFDGERTVTLCFKDTGTPIDGGVIKFVGVVLYRGIWEEGKAYEAGDQVTWGGSSWTAKEDTSAKPGLSTPESRAWVMSVRRGSDGREGKPGPPGPQGMQGVKGIDGRHYSGG